MLVPACNSGLYLRMGSIEDRRAAFCEKIRREVLGHRVRGTMAAVRYAGRITKRRPEVLTRVAQDRKSEDPVFFLVYVSSAVRLFSAEDLRALLETCRKNNAELGVTGMPLYKDGNFMQVLEGDEEAVRGLYARIVAAPRHRGEITLQEGFAEGRQFQIGRA